MFPNEMFLLGKTPNCMWSRFQNWKGGTEGEVSLCAHRNSYDGLSKNICKDKIFTPPTEIPQREIKTSISNSPLLFPS